MATKKKAAEPAEKKPTKAKSKWLFPRATLEMALKIPVAIKDLNGGNPWETEEVRKAVGSVGGGNAWFYLTAASRDYGLTSGTRDTPKIQLEDLGRDIVYAPNAEVELQLKNAVSDVRKYAEQRTEIEAERRSFIDKWRSDHNQQLVQARKDLSEAHETLNKANRMEDFTALKSPEDAVVLELADLSVGSVLREAETLITLVPDSAELYVEAKIKTRDISYLKVGNAVRVKLESYPFQRFGTLNGRLDVISPDSVPLKQSDEKSELVYLAQVRLNDSPQELVRRHLILRPGLVATAEIKTGKRSIISYVLNPILRTSDESMREP